MPAIQQKGFGDVRPLVVWYWCGNQELLDTLSDNVCVITSGAEHKFHYTNPENPTLTQIKKQYGEQLGCEFSTVMLVGFSAGCQAVRQQLIEGERPNGIIVCDGVHSSKPPQNWQLTPWRTYLQQCGAEFPSVPYNPPSDGLSRIRWTTSNIDPVEYAGTLATLNLVTGLELEPGASKTNPTTVVSETVNFLCYPGTDADAHIYQGTTVLPDQHALMAEELNIAPGSTSPTPKPFKPGVPLQPGSEKPAPEKKPTNAIALGLVAALIVFIIAQEF